MKRHSDAEARLCTVALAGNPNVGKSTLFNALTGLHQHTGNWTGKTVSCAKGEFCYDGRRYRLIDLPGTYSMTPHAAEEQAARDFLISGQADVICVVCDALTLSRQLILVLQLMRLSERPMVVVLNFCQEAQRRGIMVDAARLQQSLGVSVVPVEARERRAVRGLCRVFARCAEREAPDDMTPLLSPVGTEHSPEQLAALAQHIAADCTQHASKGEPGDTRDRKLDRILTGRLTGFFVMLALLALLFWITLVGANGISDCLMDFFTWAENGLFALAVWLRLPDAITSALLFGMFRTVGWVVSVMLPPMALFFPLFTVLEDLGYLPRIAFNLDRAFARAHGSGKQALTMCMGFGCNAVGVTGCRIVDSSRERRIAMLTNSFVPCNGRFPTLISLIGLFLVSTSGLGGTLASAGFLTLGILCCVASTLFVSRLLSVTLLRGETGSFVLELPPYRPPRVGEVIVRSVLDRTLFVLGRAIAVAAPAGLVLWLLAHISVGEHTLLLHLASGLDPLGRFLGMDGVILLAFVLALPAAEIFVPVMIMIYRAGGTLEPLGSLEGVRDILLSQGWTTSTAVCVMLFLLFHWPCATTIWTLKKESGGWRWALLGCAIPTMLGVLLCMAVATIARVFGV